MTARILIIAGSDSGGGAGIQADIKTVTMLGGHTMTAITAVTAQNTLGVAAVHAVPTDMVIAQIDAVLSDIGVDAVKIGMIGSAETANAVAERLAEFDVPIVFDPVMVATSGASLANKSTIEAMDRLARLSSLVTPNLPELAVLCGCEIVDSEHAEAEAQTYAARVGAAVLVKGGHADGATITDTLIELDGTVTCWTDTRIETTSTHGTGCTLASAIATGLGQGMNLVTAIARARLFVREALRKAPGLGSGHGPMGHQFVRDI